MDAKRFDSLTRRWGAPTSRRTAVGAGLAGGVLGALGLARAIPDTRAAQAGTCTVAVIANVRVGPSVQIPLLEEGAPPGELRGDLRFALSATGQLQNGELRLADGTSFPVVGQATGFALQARIALSERNVLVISGVGAREIAACQGAIDGLVAGPQIGDIGDWHGVGQGSASPGTGGQGGSQGGTSQGGGATATQTPQKKKKKATPTPPAGPPGAPPPTSPPPTGGTPAPEPCPSGQQRCDDVCIDITSDDEHCGACGNVCGPVGPDRPAVFTFCENGICVAPQCPAGTTDCNGYCADLMTSPVHCGRCGIACAADQICQAGVCTAAQPCATGLTNCNGVCVDLNTDAAYCGECGVSCVAGYVCVAGDCQPAQPVPCVEQGQSCASAECCVGYCGQDETCECISDGLQCAGTGTGGCCSGQPCNADGFCGTCGTPGTPCNADAECCQGSYAALCCFDGVSLRTICTDVTNIGFVCPGEPTAPIACGPGLTDCGGVCVDVMANAGNCGACGNSCPLGGVCTGGVCSAPPLACVLTQTNCGGVCVDLMADAGNCGACGNSCPLGGVCTGGVCSAPAPACLGNGTPCTYGVDTCCAGLTCLSGVCQCSPPGDVCGDPTVCCSGVCNADGFCA